jgi:hypothetical protein
MSDIWQNSPMLDTTFEPEKLTTWRVIFRQPLYDGFRAIWDGRSLKTTENNEIVSVPHILYDLKTLWHLYPLDGYLISPKGFEDLSGKVRRVKNVIYDPEIKFLIYDAQNPDQFEKRIEDVKKRYKRVDHVSVAPIELVDFSQISASAHFDEPESVGTLFKRGESFYDYNQRSNNFMRLRKITRGEFTCVGVNPQKNYEKIPLNKKEKGAKQYADGTWYKIGKSTTEPLVGSLVLTTSRGQYFELGNGFSYEDRQKIWFNQDEVKGRTILIEYCGTTKDGLPKHAKFVQLNQ